MNKNGNRMSSRLYTLSAVFLAVIFTCMLLFAGQEVSAAQQGVYVYDLAGLLSGDEYQTLETRAAEIENAYGCSVYILTVEDYTEYGSGGIFDVADAIYQTNELGSGEDHNGVMLMLSMAERDYATYFFGPVADYAFDSYGQEQMEKEFLDDFGENNWMGGFTDYQNVVADYLQRAADGHPVRLSKVPMIFILAAVSMIISLLICLVLRKKSRTVQTAAGARRYSTAGVKLTGQSEHFTHITTTRTRIARQSSSSGSSGHTSSSGGSGRSGKF